MKNNLYVAWCQTGSSAPVPAELGALGAPGREGTGHSQPPLAAIATILRPPGLLDIPLRNFPFGTSLGLAIHCPSVGGILQSCHEQSQAEKDSFDTQFWLRKVNANNFPEFGEKN